MLRNRRRNRRIRLRHLGETRPVPWKRSTPPVPRHRDGGGDRRVESGLDRRLALGQRESISAMEAVTGTGGVDRPHPASRDMPQDGVAVLPHVAPSAAIGQHHGGPVIRPEPAQDRRGGALTRIDPRESDGQDEVIRQRHQPVRLWPDRPFDVGHNRQPQCTRSRDDAKGVSRVAVYQEHPAPGQRVIGQRLGGPVRHVVIVCDEPLAVRPDGDDRADRPGIGAPRRDGRVDPLSLEFARAWISSQGRSFSHPMNPACPPSRATATSAVATLPP